MTESDALVRLTLPGELQNHLNEMSVAKGIKHASVGLLYRGCHDQATIGDSLTEIGDSKTPVGCITKLFTAALLRRAATRKLLRLDDSLSLFLSRAIVPDTFAQIDLLQLSNHLHGLDDSCLFRAPLQSDGFIDLRLLCSALSSADPIGIPGHFYSYGHAGAWLTAGVLEQLYGVQYAELLDTELLRPLGISSVHAKSAPTTLGTPDVCPATGGTLSMSILDLLRFLEDSIHYFAAEPVDTRQPQGILPTSLPGWHSVERGIQLGWKCYDHGWFGHNSEVPGAGIFVRINPIRRIGIAVASKSHPPTTVASAIFRPLLPALVDFQIPKLLPNRTITSDDAAQYVGGYGNAALSVLIDKSGTDTLLIKANRRASPGLREQMSIEGRMVQANDNIFFTQPTFPDFFSFLQFVNQRRSKFQYLWTGSQMLPRLGGVPEGFSTT